MNIFKKIGINLAACFFASGIIAQDTEMYKTSIYFASGKSNLDEIAQAELAKFINSIGNVNDFELDIRAYTDDIGSDKYNRQLAVDRAKAIEASLTEKNIVAYDTKVQGIGEIELAEAVADAAEARRQNRRVDIVVMPFAPQSLSDFYGFFSRRNTQKFCVRPNRDTTILGTKGTVLFIPAGSFCTADGKIATAPVHIELQEAYSYQDMLLHNLGTVSDGQMLETGGMVHISAALAGGEKLQVKEGGELMLSMPTATTNDDKMKLFVANRPAGTPTAAINWTTDNRDFLPNTFQSNIPEFNFSAVKIEPMSEIERFNLPTFPNLGAELLAPAAPKVPYYSSEVVPTKEKTAEIYKKVKGESDSEYQTRLEKQFDMAMRSYTQKIESNAKNRERYESAKAAYEIQLAEYQKNVAIRQQQLTSLSHYLYDNKKEIDEWTESFNWANNGFLEKVVGIAKQTEKLAAYRDFLVQECQRNGFTAEARRVQETDLIGSNDLIKSMARKFIRCAQSSKSLFVNRFQTTPKEVSRQLADLCYISENAPDSLKNLGCPISTLDYEDKISLENIFKILEHYQAQVTLFNDIIKNYNDVVEKVGFYEEAKKVDAICKQLDPAYNMIMEKRIAESENSRQMRQEYLRTVGINRLGWINCDKFSSVGGDRITIRLNTEVNTETNFYAVFENIRSVMPFYGTIGGKFAVSGVPANEKVILVGVRVVDGKAEVCVEKATASQLNNLKINFHPAKLSELRDLLNV